MTREIDALLEAAAAARARMLQRTHGLSPSDAGERLSPGRWSIVDILEHLTLAEHGGIHMMWIALEANRRGEPVWRRPAEEGVTRRPRLQRLDLRDQVRLDVREEEGESKCRR